MLKDKTVFPFSGSHDIEGLLKIFQFDNKRDLKKHCRSLSIYMDDFINLIGLCESYNIGLKHRIYHRDIIPPHLDPNRLEIRAILNQPSSESKEREKKFRKMFQLLRDRRYLIAHVFYLPPGSKHWHFFYFDQRDILETKNHWHYGPHIHLVNYLWPNYTAKGIWQQFMSGKPEIHGAEHIRWVGDFK